MHLCSVAKGRKITLIAVPMINIFMDRFLAINTSCLKSYLVVIELGVENNKNFNLRRDEIEKVKTASNEAGIVYGKKVEGGFVFGDLRRTAKTLMARAGVDKAYRDAILGHESQDMDRHYLHPDFDKDLRSALAKYTAWLIERFAYVTQNVIQAANLE